MITAQAPVPLQVALFLQIRHAAPLELGPLAVVDSLELPLERRVVVPLAEGVRHVGIDALQVLGSDVALLWVGHRLHPRLDGLLLGQGVRFN